MALKETEFDLILSEQVQDSLGNSWKISPKTTISNINEPQIQINLFVQDSSNLIDERQLEFILNTEVDLRYQIKENLRKLVL